VGGGLGTVPYQAKLFDEFVSEEELLPLAQAISRVYARLGEKKNRNTARIKFLVNKLGIEEFKRLVLEERATLPHDDRWTAYLADVAAYEETPLKPPSLLQIDGVLPEGYARWHETNVYQQRQPGYATVTVTLPLGDITAQQLRKLADVAREYVKETVRTTVEQNFVLRWVSEADLPAVYEELKSVGLHAPGAGTIVDITACPGTDTCKLGIASSRGLAGELRTRLLERSAAMDRAVSDLHIKVSGCFNSCGQHHVADLGFYGVSRNKNNYTVPHFQVVLGGQWEENAGSYGLAIGAVPSKRIPEAVDRITSRYLAERAGDETFQAFIKRIGKAECKKMLEDLTPVPAHEEDASFYTDWHDAREFTIGDMGVGECAGEVVAPIDFALTACEREVFEAQLLLEGHDFDQAAHRAYESMLHGAVALLRQKAVLLVNDPDTIIREFRIHFYDTQLFFDPFALGKFAQYFFRAHELVGTNGHRNDEESAHRLIEEAQLFLEACHSTYGRMMAGTAA
jgi:sulfite reductase (ferredoxin)